MPSCISKSQLQKLLMVQGDTAVRLLELTVAEEVKMCLGANSVSAAAARDSGGFQKSILLIGPVWIFLMAKVAESQIHQISV